jgi:superfamily II DNA or RNA helicase
MGFIHALRSGCAATGVALEFDDRRSRGVALPPIVSQISLRDYQIPMHDAMLSRQVGVVEAPTAAGKTAVTLQAICTAGRSAIVIVEKASLAQQWVDACRNLLSMEAGYLGEGGLSYGPIMIALRQSIYARMDELGQQRFFDSFGTVVCDEAHHSATAWTLIEVLQRFNSLYRWGATATPDRNPEYFPVLQAVIGPVIWETTVQDASEHLVIPSVRVLDSAFTFDDYHPTRRSLDTATNRYKTERNNYGDMVAALCADHDRNLMIAAAAALEARAGHHVLIVSDRTEHLKAIHELLGDKDWIYSLTGADKGARALEIKEAIETASTGTVLLSTVAEEGLSIDRLDRVIPAYPRRNPETMRQVAGRVMRPFAGKTDAEIIDVRDPLQSLLRSQFQGRAQLLYRKEGWDVHRS